MNATIALLKIVCIENNSSLTSKVHSSVSTRFILFLFESNIFKRLSTKAKALQKSLCAYVCIVFRSHTMSRWCCTHTHTSLFFYLLIFVCRAHTYVCMCCVYFWCNLLFLSFLHSTAEKWITWCFVSVNAFSFFMKETENWYKLATA